jgi:hypothetical protein
MRDYDDPAVIEQWCEERRAQVTTYLHDEGVEHGRVGDWPAWHLAPYISIWAIESRTQSGSIGWWAICGDVPTDHISAAGIENPRDAMRAVATEWHELAKLMSSGESLPNIRIGQPEEWASLAPLLQTRASMLLQWADDDALWNDLDTPQNSH